MAFSIVKKDNQTEVISCGLTTIQIHYVFIEKRINRLEFLISSDGGYLYSYEDFNQRYPFD